MSERKVIGYSLKVFFPSGVYMTSKDINFDESPLGERLSRELFEHLKSKGVNVWINKIYEPLPPLDYSQIEDVEVDGINTRDYPDFCDAYISSATYQGREMNEDELEQLNDDRGFVSEHVDKRLY